MRHWLGLGFALLLGLSHAWGQAPVRICVMQPGTNNCVDAGLKSPFPATLTTNVPTYSAGFNIPVPNNQGSDLVTITGSATKLVKLRKLIITGFSSTYVALDLAIVKRSSLDTGGTPSTQVATPNDSSNPPATAVITSYSTATANGTSVGELADQNLVLTSATTALVSIPAFGQFGGQGDQPIVLRGANECIGVNLSNAGTPASTYISVWLEWTEE